MSSERFVPSLASLPVTESTMGRVANSVLRTYPIATPAFLYSSCSAEANAIYDSFATTVSCAVPASLMRSPFWFTGRRKPRPMV